MILTSDFSSLTDDLQSIFNEVAKTSIADMVGYKVFNVKETNRLTHDHLILHGLDVIRKVAEGQDLPTTTLVQGDNITFTQSYYGGIVSVTKKMRKFDLFDQIERLVRSVTADAFHKIDQSMADVLTNGFSSSNYTDVYGESVSAVGPDGLALFSASHTNNINANTFRNLIRYNGASNPVISREAIVQARVDAMTYVDPTGHNRPINLNVILVAPSKYDEVLRIVNSSQISGSNENDVNPLKGTLKVMQWEKLQTRTGGTDTSAYWFMFDSSLVSESLMALFAEKPSLDAPEQVYKNKNWDYSLDFFYTLGRGFPAYVWGSNASGS